MILGFYRYNINNIKWVLVQVQDKINKNNKEMIESKQNQIRIEEVMHSLVGSMSQMHQEKVKN